MLRFLLAPILALLLFAPCAHASFLDAVPSTPAPAPVAPGDCTVDWVDSTNVCPTYLTDSFERIEAWQAASSAQEQFVADFVVPAEGWVATTTAPVDLGDGNRRIRVILYINSWDQIYALYDVTSNCFWYDPCSGTIEKPYQDAEVEMVGFRWHFDG